MIDDRAKHCLQTASKTLNSHFGHGFSDECPEQVIKLACSIMISNHLMSIDCAINDLNVLFMDIYDDGNLAGKQSE